MKSGNKGVCHCPQFSALGNAVDFPCVTQNFQQAVQQGSTTKSITWEELFLVQLSSALLLDVQKPRPVGK